MKLEVKKIGNSTGVILPKDILSQLDLAQGDWLYATKMADGSLRLTQYDPHHEEVVETAREVMKEYRDTFRALAK